jgi:type IV pilus assembly protein PilC
MPTTYAYKVRDRKGSMVTGEIVADGPDLVFSKLREMQYIPLEVKAKSSGLKREFHLLPEKAKLKDLSVFSRQFATMVNSGLPLLRTLAILEEQTQAKYLARVVGEMRLDIEGGLSLSAAMAKHPRAFNRLFVSMVRAGETAGTMDDVLLRLADTLEREVSLRRQIKSAMTYPIVVSGLVVVILTAMLVFVVPTFKDLYTDLGGTLPLPTRILVALSDMVRQYFLIVVGAFIAMIWLVRRWAKTDKGRMAFDRFKLKLPIFGGLFHKSALSRFARTLSVMSRSGVPILQALDIVHETVNNAVVAVAVKDLQSGVKEGESLATPLSKHEVFPPMVVQMIAVGEETGALDTMLEKVANFYDEEVSATVESLTSLIEPVLIAVVGGAVGAIVISLYLPTFKIFELIK